MKNNISYEEQERRRKVRNHVSEYRDSIEHILDEKHGRKCATCGIGYGLEIDHIVPVAKGGDSSIKNLQYLCWQCHKKKHASKKGKNDSSQSRKRFRNNRIW